MNAPRHPVGKVALLAVALHTLAVLWIWRSWGVLGRGTILAWLDFPVSLAWLQLEGRALLLCSLAVGGLQWAVIGAALTWGVGRALRRPA